MSRFSEVPVRMLTLSFTIVAAVAFAQPKPTTDDAALALAELGLKPATAGELPAKYAADGVAAKQVKDNPKDYPVRAAVLKAVAALEPARTVDAISFLKRNSPDELAKLVLPRQTKVATILIELDEAREAFEELTPEMMAREKSARWQAHALLMQAELNLQSVQLQEYNRVLGDVRIQSLPDLAKDSPGWNLVRQEMVRGTKELRDRAALSRKLIDRVLAEHPKTPWAAQATEWKGRKLGFAWEPAK
jgi:hypothetical protein